MVMLLCPWLYEIIVVHIRWEQKQKWPVLQFQAFSLGELLFTLRQPDESEDLSRVPQPGWKPHFLFFISNNGPDTLLHHGGVDFTTRVEKWPHDSWTRTSGPSCQRLAAEADLQWVLLPMPRDVAQNMTAGTVLQHLECGNCSIPTQTGRCLSLNQFNARIARLHNNPWSWSCNRRKQ